MSAFIKSIDWDKLPDHLEGISLTKLAGSLAIAVVGYKIIYALFFSPLRRIPGPFIARLTSLPAILTSAGGESCNQGRAQYEQHGDIYVHAPNAIVIVNPEDARRVLESHRFVKSKLYEGIDALGLPNSLSGRDPAFVQMRQRQLAPLFNETFTNQVEPIVLRNGILALKDRWDSLLSQSSEASIEINYSSDFALAAYDVVGGLLFGRELNSLKDNDNTVGQWVAGTIQLHGVQSLMPIFKYPPFSLAVRHWQALFDTFCKFSASSIAERKASVAGGSAKPRDYLQGFLDAEDPESKTGMGDIEIQGEANICFLAGADTTSNALKWAIHLLTLHPDAYAIAVDQVRGQFPADHVITYAEAKKCLPYVEACLYESMRLCPADGDVAPRVSPPGGITLQGHFIPAGTDIYVSYAALGMHKGVWSEPHKFDPLRFMDNEEAHANLFAFSQGVRICPGRHLAKMTLLTVLANMLNSYDWALPADFTHLGPLVLDKNGYPKQMESHHVLVTAPVNPERDCRLVLSPRV